MKIDILPSPLDFYSASSDLLEKITVFFSTHPLPVFVTNTVNGFLGYGVDLHSRPGGIQSTIRESLEDITSTQ